MRDTYQILMEAYRTIMQRMCDKVLCCTTLESTLKLDEDRAVLPATHSYAAARLVSFYPSVRV